MVAPTTVYLVLLVGQGVLGAGFAALLLRKLRKPEEALVSFQLKPDATILDFKLLVLFAGCQFVAYGITLVGGLLDAAPAIIGGSILGVTTAYIGVYVYYRWWRRLG